jgi:hypothetical protein
MPPSLRSLVTVSTGRLKMLKRKSTNSLSASAKTTQAYFGACHVSYVNDYESSTGLRQVPVLAWVLFGVRSPSSLND